MRALDWQGLFCQSCSRAAVGTAILLGVLSCAPVASRSPAVTDQIPQKALDPGELVRNLLQREQQLRSLRALATVEYSSWRGRGKFQEVVVIRRPDRLRLETLSQLGAVLIVTAANDEVVGFHPQERLFYRGRSSKENLSRYTQIPLELEEVTRLLLGLPPVDLSGRWEGNGGSLSWQREGGGRETITFDPTRGLPLKWERFDGNGEIEFSAGFSDFAVTSGVPFPMTLSFSAPMRQLQVELRYQEPELNVVLPESLFVVEKPPHVRELPLESLGG
ncbi:MAG: DUF4292 domain-containing protein [Deltaproteobacteria bacterium]|nr:DUF4292 domain-containing protein [Deltaproteobacteria bacterium]